MEIRQEDLGKMMLKNADILDINITKEKLLEFFRDSRNSLYLLYSKNLNYFTVFKNNSMLAEQSTNNFIDFANESTFMIIPQVNEDAALETHQMNEIVEIEYNKNINAVEIWIGKGNPHYFQLMPWDESSVHI